MKREQEENHSISGQSNIQEQLTVYNLIFVEKKLYTRMPKKKNQLFARCCSQIQFSWESLLKRIFGKLNKFMKFPWQQANY